MPRKPGPWLPASLFLFLSLVLVATLTRVPAGSHAVQRGGFGVGAPKVLGPGLHFRIPLLQTVHRYPSAPLAVDGTGDFTSSEGVSLRGSPEPSAATT